MTRSQPLLGVIFDMDGVLCDSEHFICAAACRMFETRHGKRVAPEDFSPFVGTGEDRYLGGVAEKHGVTLDMPADKVRTYEIYLELIRGKLPPLPGAVEFIAQCRRRSLRIAVGSSADRMKVEGNLREIGVPWAKFDAVVTGSDVARKKPAPDLFLEAANRMGVDPARCVVVEDAPSGIKAGKAAGAMCLGLTTSFDERTLRDAGADWIAPDLARVPGGVLGV